MNALRHLRQLRVVAVVLAVLAGGCGDANESEVQTERRPASHMRMVQILRGIAERTDEEHWYFGTARFRKLHGVLEERGDAAPLDLRVETAIAALLVQRTELAIDILVRTRAALADGSLDAGAERNAASVVAFYLGICYLRRGETENCCAAPSADSCILPIRGGGLHAKPFGSRKATECFLAVLADRHATRYQVYASRWLLNVAAMTLGEHPDGVPAEHRIPASAFTATGGASDSTDSTDLETFPRFVDRANELGVDRFDLAGGVVTDDFDGDGVLDLMTSSWDTHEQVRLYLRREDGAFEDVTSAAGLDGILGGLNMVQADYDNDGDVDVLVLRGAWLFDRGRHPNSLLRNDGGGRFTDVTFEAGLAIENYPTQTAAWADFDLDGDLDLYIGNESSPRGRFPCQLFRNEGDGQFTDIASSAGVENFGCAKSVAWGDFDGDRDPDLYVSNNGLLNRLYRNEGGGRFVDIAPRLGVEAPVASFPTWFWDFDNDGALDLFVASYGTGIGEIAGHYLGETVRFDRDRLYRGDGAGGLRDVGAAVGLDYPTLPMGSNFGDLDGDGWLDMYLGTGSPEIYNLMPNLLFLNRGGKRFVDATMASRLGHLQKGHGVAFADFDEDGDLDLFTQLGGAYPCDGFRDALWENPGFGDSNRWIRIRAIGHRSNRSAIGTRIRVVVTDAEGGERSIYRTVGSGGSFGASPLRQTIGLGRAQSIDRIELFWPCTGETQVVADVQLDTALAIDEVGGAKVIGRPPHSLALHR